MKTLSTSLSRARFAGGIAAAAASTAMILPAKAATFTFRAGSTLPEEHPSTVNARQMWTSIERESGGRLRVEFYPNSALGNDSSLLSQLRLGAIQFVIGAPLFIQSVVPLVAISVVGFTFKDADEGLHAMDGPLGDYVRKEVAAKGFFTPRLAWDSGSNVITSGTHPIRDPDDLKGFKMRVAVSKITIDMFKTLGASPVPISANEVYTSLQTHIVDGEDAPMGTIEARHDFEVQKYLSLTYHSWTCLNVLMHGETWKNLPPDLQAVIERNNTRFATRERRDSKLRTAAVRDLLSRQGLTINRVDPAPFRPRLRTFYETWAAEFGPTAWGLLQSSISGKLG